MRNFFIILLFTQSYKLHAQHQERKVLVYNIAFGGITGGVGAVINKPKSERWTKSFIKGFWQGCIGGTVNYAAKKTTYLMGRNNEPAYAWPAKILHSAGSSIIENAALQKPFLDSWNFDLGPLRFDYSFRNNKIKTRLLPMAVGNMIYGFIHGKLDGAKSVAMGNMVFRTDQLIFDRFAGFSTGRAILYYEPFGSDNTLMAHELVHQFQFREYQVLNTWVNKMGEDIAGPKLENIFRKYIYFDAPYFWGIYLLEGYQPEETYFRNFFEFEAELFATNRYVPVR